MILQVPINQRQRFRHHPVDWNLNKNTQGESWLSELTGKMKPIFHESMYGSYWTWECHSSLLCYPKVFQIPPEVWCFRYFWGPNTSSPGVWKPKVTLPEGIIFCFIFSVPKGQTKAMFHFSPPQLTTSAVRKTPGVAWCTYLEDHPT